MSSSSSSSGLQPRLAGLPRPRRVPLSEALGELAARSSQCDEARQRLVRVVKAELRLHKRPVETLGHFRKAVGSAAAWRGPNPAVCASASLAACAVLAGARGAARSGAYGERIENFARLVELGAAYAAWWFVCGVLSTVGLGSGLQTGALFLLPHVARLAVDYRLTGCAPSVEAQLRDAWLAAPTSGSPGASCARSLRLLVARAALPGFFSGAGSAVGELAPFALARALAAGGRDPFQLVGFGGEELWSHTRTRLEASLRTHAFAKIFVLAAVPNALFDVCGLVCGATGVEFHTFFGAVFSAKALLRAPLQTSALALLLASPDDDRADDQRRRPSPGLRDVLFRLAAHLLRRVDDTDGGPARLPHRLLRLAKQAWNALALALFALFLASTVEQVAQQRALAHLLLAAEHAPQPESDLHHLARPAD